MCDLSATFSHGSLSNLPFQQKYRAEFEKNKGKMIGLKGLEDDINIAHSVYATKLQSDVRPSSVNNKKKNIGCIL